MNISRVVLSGVENSDAIKNCLNRRDELRAKELLLPIQRELYATSSSRYRPSTGSKCQELAKAVFQIALQTKHSEIEGAVSSTYPLWKRVVWIDLPRAVSATLKHRLLQLVCAICFAIIFLKVGIGIHQSVVDFTATTLIPWVRMHAPAQAVSMYRVCLDAVNFVNKNWYRLFICGWIIEMIIPRLRIPYLSALVERIAPSTLVWNLTSRPETIFEFLFRHTIFVAWFARDLPKTIAPFFDDIAYRSSLEKSAPAIKQAQALWLQAACDGAV